MASKGPDGKQGYWLEGSLNKVFLQTGKWGNEFYFNLLPGYTRPELTVLSNGEPVSGIKVNRAEDLGEDNHLPGYEYQFDIPNRLTDNVEVFVTAEKEQYTVQYIVNGKLSNIKDPGSYTIFEGDNNETLIGGIPEYDTENYVFEGWVYNGKTYQPNDVFGFNSESVAGADENGVISHQLH